MKQKEIQGIFDQQKWPGILSRDEAQRIFIDEQKKPRLLMLVPPPDISDDFPISFRDSLKKEIRNQLKLFLEKYYPLSGDYFPVEFYGKYFERSILNLGTGKNSKKIFRMIVMMKPRVCEQLGILLSSYTSY